MGLGVSGLRERLTQTFNVTIVMAYDTQDDGYKSGYRVIMGAQKPDG